MAESRLLICSSTALYCFSSLGSSVYLYNRRRSVQQVALREEELQLHLLQQGAEGSEGAELEEKEEEVWKEEEEEKEEEVQKEEEERRRCRSSRRRRCTEGPRPAQR